MDKWLVLILSWGVVMVRARLGESKRTGAQ